MNTRGEFGSHDWIVSTFCESIRHTAKAFDACRKARGLLDVSAACLGLHLQRVGDGIEHLENGGFHILCGGTHFHLLVLQCQSYEEAWHAVEIAGVEHLNELLHTSLHKGFQLEMCTKKFNKNVNKNFTRSAHIIDGITA